MSGINPYEHVPTAHLEVIEIALDSYRYEHGWDDDIAAIQTVIEEELGRRRAQTERDVDATQRWLDEQRGEGDRP